MQSERTAIVTGAGKRVGRVIAAALLGDGWKVVAHVHGESDSVPQGATKAVADLEEPSCADTIFRAADGLPPVRLLVNNAARFAWDGFGQFSVAEFDAHMRSNVRAPALLVDELVRRHAGGDTLVVNILDAKLSAPNPDFLSYTLSKQALLGLTSLAARALADKGIRVNAIAPGLMLRSPGQSEDNFRAMHERNPLGRGVTSGEIVAALDYLLAASTVTSEVLTIDAGQKFAAPSRDVQFLEP